MSIEYIRFELHGNNAFMFQKMRLRSFWMSVTQDLYCSNIFLRECNLQYDVMCFNKTLYTIEAVLCFIFIILLC